MTASLRLLSVHINKTAGTSFGQLLQKNYRSVFRINTHIGTRRPRRSLTCDGKDLLNRIPADAEVVHGHFTADEIFIEGIPLVTWVRDPVYRVVSNYHYVKSDLSLIDWAALEDSRNRMSKMLSKIPLEKFFFIGLMEQFDNDLVLLADMLGWQHRTPEVLNPTHYEPVDSSLRKEIAALNQEDVLLYNKVREMRC